MTAMKFHAETLRREWLDDYGHLNEAFYLVPFSNASWKMQEHFGIGVAYFRETGCALYTLESHLRYLKEVRAPAELEIETMIFAADEKRMRFAHCMFASGEVRASGEFMALHYDTRAKKSAPFPVAVAEKLRRAKVKSLPEWAGRRIGF